MRALASPPRTPAVLLLTVGLTALGSWILLFHGGALSAGLVLALALLIAAVRFPEWMPSYLLAVCALQPLVLRILPLEGEAWTFVHRLDEFSVAALLPPALVRHLLGRTPALPRNTAWALAALCAIGGVSSAVQHTAPRLVALDGFLLLKGFAFFVILSAVRLDEAKLKSWLRLALGLALVAALVGLVEMLAPDLVRGALPLQREGIRLGRAALISIFDNEGQAAWFFACFAVGCFAFYNSYRHNGLLGLFGLFTLCSVLTMRRKPIGGLLVALLFSLILIRRWSGRLRAAAILAVAAGGLLVAFGDTLVALFSEGYQTYVAARDSSIMARNAMYRTSFELALDYFPGGVGFGLFGGFVSQANYSPIYGEYGLDHIWGLSPLHNRFMLDAFWPHVLGQFGFFGLAAFVAALAGIWQPLIRRAARAATGLGGALAFAAALAFVEALVESAAAPVFESTLSAFLLFGLAGLATASGAEDRR